MLNKPKVGKQVGKKDKKLFVEGPRCALQVGISLDSENYVKVLLKSGESTDISGV